MSLRFLSAVSVGGISLYHIYNSEIKFKKVFNSWTSHSSSSWDSNWDHRANTSLIKPLPEVASPEKENEYNEKLEKARSKVTRHIILIRHGQYNLEGSTDSERSLTDLGRQQAKLTGQRLAELKLPIDNVVISTMTRAQETGKLILDQLPMRETIAVQNDSLIEEGAPIEPGKKFSKCSSHLLTPLLLVPKVAHWNPDPHDFFQEGSRIEAGFRAHIHRADPAQEKESYTMLVCHGNVIRYFVCRALQFNPSAWLRFNIHHASITWLVLYPNGRVVLRLFGDCGHFPTKFVTLS